jgi:alpha-aminoadipate/glutamate carrier protein LysW
MSLETTVCPVCKQKLAVFHYVAIGSEVVCANPTCLTPLRVESRGPLKVAVVPQEQTYNVDSRPESYG